MPLPAALSPLQGSVFRGLWFAWLAANMTMWMNDVAAAWLMTTLTTSPVMVALVQTASTLPVFLLGLPSDAVSSPASDSAASSSAFTDTHSCVAA